MAVMLQCRDLGFSYNGGSVLSGVNFDLHQGKFLAVLGRNGSGKTTLLHCLNRVLTPDAGCIRINGQDICSLSRTDLARQVSLVPQEQADMFPFRVLDVAVMGRAPFLGLSQRPGPGDYDKAMDALKQLNARRLAHRNFNRISGGERKLALLARALVQSGRVMLLDEPTNHLDFNNQYRLLSTVTRLCRKQGLSIAASLHDPNMAALFADQVVMLKQGRVMAKGPVQEVMTPDTLSDLYETNIGRFQQPLFFPRDIIKERLHA